MYTDEEWDAVDAWGAWMAGISAVGALLTIITLTTFKENRRADHVVPLAFLNFVLGVVHVVGIATMSRRERFCKSDTIRFTSQLDEPVSLCTMEGMFMAYTWMVICVQLVVDAWKLFQTSMGRHSEHGAAMRVAGFILALVPILALYFNGQAGYADGSPYVRRADITPTNRGGAAAAAAESPRGTRRGGAAAAT